MEETMSDTTTSTTTTDGAAPSATTTDGATTTTDAGATDLGDAGKKALAAERTARAAAEKSAKDLQAKLDAAETSKLTEQEQTAKRLSDLETQLAERELLATKQRVALAKGIPSELVGRLQGTTEAELTADAEALLPMLASKTTTPKPDLTQGPRGGAAATGDPSKDFAAFLNGQLNRR